MLPRDHRLTSAEDFRRTIRGGRRAGTSSLVVHLTAESRDIASLPTKAPARVGFVVSKAVGNAVVRNLTKRRLRAHAGALLADLPPGCTLVIRALPPAAQASYADLGVALGRCLQRVRP